VAKYKKKRARELKQDVFRDTAMSLMDQLGNRLEGKGWTIIYGLGGAAVLALLIWLGVAYYQKHNNEARAALGRAIRISSGSVSQTPSLDPEESGLNFSTEQERAQKAIDEFKKVEAKYGDPYRTEARYFIATNLLYIDRNQAMNQLGELSGNRNKDVAALARFALAQATESDGKLDEAAKLYQELAAAGSAVVPAESANFRLAMVLEKQGKKKEASDLLFNLVDSARKAKDAEGNPVTQSQAARDAARELEKLDPDRSKQLTPEAPSGLPF